MVSLYKKWSPDEVDLWERQKVQGKNAFILQFGLKTWATIMFVSLMFISYITAPDKSVFGFWYILETIVFNAALAGGGGYLYGYLVWHGTEKSYQHWKNSA